MNLASLRRRCTECFSYFSRHERQPGMWRVFFKWGPLTPLHQNYHQYLSNLLLGFTELESMELAFFKNPQLILMETNDWEIASSWTRVQILESDSPLFNPGLHGYFYVIINHATWPISISFYTFCKVRVVIPPFRAARTLPSSVIMWLVLSRPQWPEGPFSFLILTPLSSLKYIREDLTVPQTSLWGRRRIGKCWKY